MSNEKLDGMMRKIKGLLANADDPATPPAAADTFRAKAESLMQKYRIEETELMESGALYAETITPKRDVIVVCPATSNFYNTYYGLVVYACNHAGVRYNSAWRVVDGVYSLVVDVVGFESDIRFADVIYQSARIVFADRMEPKVDPSLSDEDNVYRMRSAGIERIKIAARMGYGDTNSATAKVTRLYKKACEARGESAMAIGRDFNVKIFREEYSNGFITEFYNRLWRARNAAAQGSGNDIVLHGRKEAVDEAFYNAFPNLRPKAAVGNGGKTSSRVNHRWTKADEARAQRRNTKAGQAGTYAGKEAAREVNLGKPSPGRLD